MSKSKNDSVNDILDRHDVSRKDLDHAIYAVLMNSEDDNMIDAALALCDIISGHDELHEKVNSDRPVCPHCNSEMVEAHYSGYYDSFDHWNCNCDELPYNEDNNFRGSYA